MIECPDCGGEYDDSFMDCPDCEWLEFKNECKNCGSALCLDCERNTHNDIS